MPSAERSVTIKTSTVLKVIAILIAFGFLWLIRDILALILIALFLAALMHPAAKWGARHRIPRGIIVILIYLAMLTIAVASLALIIPTLIQEAGSVASSIGIPSDVVSSTLQTLREAVDKFRSISDVRAGVSSAQAIFSAAGGFVSTIKDLFGGIAGVVIVLVIAFYMVVQDREATRLFHNLVPNKYQDKISTTLALVEEKIGGWLRGQLVLSLLIGILYYIGLLILGVNNPLMLAVFAGFLEFIPYLGPILSGIPIVFLAVGDSPFKGLLALGLVIVVQQLENQVIVPKVMQKAVGLNPLVSIIAVLIGAKLFGVVGALIAIPVATAASVLLMELYRNRQDS